MPVARDAGGTSLVDVLERTLDKGIVVDSWVRVSLIGIDLTTVAGTRVVVASIDTYLRYADSFRRTPSVFHPFAPDTRPIPAEGSEPDEPDEPPAAAGVRSPLKPSPPTLSAGAAAVPPLPDEDLPDVRPGFGSENR